LPPPLMTDSTAIFAFVTHMLCCSCAIMCFSAAAYPENDQGWKSRPPWRVRYRLPMF
jgi:hypothetical protein